MKLCAAVVVAAVGSCAAAWLPARTAAASGLCPAPAVTSVSPRVAAPGSTVTVSGSGFAGAGCGTTIDVGGTPAPGASVQPGTITFPAAYGLSGAVRIRVNDSLGGTNISNTNLTFFTAPSIAGASPGAPAVGQAVTVSGRGFELNVPSGDEAASATYLWRDGSTCEKATAAVVSDTAISVSAPTHYCYGPLAVALTAPLDTGDPSGSRTSVLSGSTAVIDVAPSGASLAAATAPAGGAVQVQGSGFGTAGSAVVGTAGAASTWSDGSVSVAVPDTAVNNSTVTIRRAADGQSIAVGGTLDVVARVDGVSPHVAAPGSTVTISGGGFGADAGTVSVAGVSMPVRSWSPTAITVSVPGTASGGSLSVTPVDTDPPATAPALGILPAASAGGLSSTQIQQAVRAAAVDVATPAGTIVGPAPPPFNPPPHPSGPVALALHAPVSTAAAGRTVPFTVSLRSYGSPVSGATVQLVIVYEPASDGAITPTTATTDADGEVHGTVRLSRTPGEMIVLARSGQYSDEIRFIGSSATATGATFSSDAPSSKGGLPAALLGVTIALATLLLLAGAGLRIVSRA